MIPKESFDKISGMAKGFAKVPCYIKLHLVALSVVDQESAIELCIKLKMLRRKEKRVG